MRSGTQQQWFTRNSRLGSWSGASWNMVFTGVVNAPTGNWPNPSYTVVGQTPVVREKPFLYVDEGGKYAVFVPALRTSSSGTSWSAGAAAGTSLPIDSFYIARQGVSANMLDDALAQGKNLLFTPASTTFPTPCT